ncbi:aminotransferase class I/II-fold pyridoxal phosphate-dependent enzyme [Bacillus sp. TH22]|uniref:aminotransferase class I/II-fold pyridoxal phosphate-dependent enzyme n=1 Tax=unclassified Bacillus (in: firmicutes) TaxID=185979 RepID=UPI001911E290|nr:MULTISPECIES: aminotransferase class I/II-fold pyridoxal phosphate-dependent enzyme [unclassified Bacillus (in: firmicutes)]MBK5360146.1 aminotransferase class I/II-fold pyridoxal phosphate-dependent enzyme [Bacillus sp. TH44]MBK5348127.1 aminotransferase class I/II-fold pyridoxal phosphate-dependent enzyme [Bacillus sp. TH45]MBK5364974.1 aminotransferase class I/II-fold pyridoxal phosphate-dependent enzyme [Bacillus sp. TH50]MBK5449935.1 aminotransferase class I/II-fold pyridoxal phosphate-
MNQNRMPLYEALMEFKERRLLSFHVPGHKNGLNFPQKASGGFKDILSIDVTELTGLDDLHSPFQCIDEAQQLLAEVYGVHKSYFLINGSTVGNLAMILSCCGEHDIVLVQRNCHKSIINGLKLAGANPVFLNPWIDEVHNVPVGVHDEIIKEAITKYPNAKALILTHPNYYGMGIDLEASIAYAHAHKIPVLVDEAHGAHFCIGDPFPKSALVYGADIVVHSAHKTLPAMTMGSYLHINSRLVSEEKVSSYLSMLQSSSPSYPIMASLDIARFAIAVIKEEGHDEIVEFLRRFKEGLRSIPQIAILQYPSQDELKVTVETRCQLSGYELQSVFEKVGIYTEMADPYNVLFILPLQVNEGYMKAIEIIRLAMQQYKVKDKPASIRYTYKGEISPLPYTYKQLERYETKLVSIEEAVGMIAAEMVIPYPPGIPLIMYGERITQEHTKQITHLEKTGARFQGSTKYMNVYDIESRF